MKYKRYEKIDCRYSKICPVCKNAFYKKVDLSFKAWEKRIYCSLSCYNSVKHLYKHTGEAKRKIAEASGGRKLSQEAKEKIRQSKLGNKNPMKRQEVREKVSKALKGRKLSYETRLKMSLSRKGIKGKPLSEETKKKISEKLKGRFVGEKHPNYKGGYKLKLWYNHLRRMKLKEVGGSHTYEEWKELKKKCNYTCPACGRKEPEIVLTIDHIIPISRGGDDNIDNIQLLCKSCNSRKKDKTIVYIKIPLQQLAKIKFRAGAREHSDEGWENLTREELDTNLREELADAWNYAEGHINQDLIRYYLDKIYKLI